MEHYSYTELSHIPTYAEIEAKPLEWLWPDYIPLGAITLIDGNPDLGKSFFTIDLAARVSRGWRMAPEGGIDSECEPAGVVLASAEDDPARTIRPRLEAAGADLERVSPMTMINSRPLVLPDDLNHIESVVKAMQAKLVVIDPLFAFLTGKVDSNKDQDIRRVMHLLKEMAERSSCAVVVVRHLNKRSSDNEPIFRGGGSIGILGASRSTLLLGPHPTETGLRVIARIKGNLSPQPAALGFRFETVVLPTGPTARLSWIGEVEVDTVELLKHHGGKKQGQALDSAKTWLASQLLNGAKPAQVIEQAAVKEGISESTLKRAKHSLGVKSDRTSFAGGWLWEFPSKAINPNEEDQTIIELTPLDESERKCSRSTQGDQPDTS